MIKGIDADGSGAISLDELMDAYNSDDSTQERLQALGLDKTDLVKLYELMDTDGEGEVSYVQIVSQLRKAENADQRMQLMMIKLHLDRLDVVMNTRMNNLEDAINR